MDSSFSTEAIELNRYSKVLTQDPTQPAAQAMLYGIGLTDDDMQKEKDKMLIKSSTTEVLRTITAHCCLF